jgi:carboxylesterase type B
LETLIISHVSDEARIFTPNVDTRKKWDAYISSVFPGQPSSIAAVNQHFQNMSDFKDKAKAFVDQSTFVCNTRYLSQAYPTKTYNMQYSGIHGSDLLAIFYRPGSPEALAAKAVSRDFAGFAQVYQSYLLSHARSGDPNTYSDKTGKPPAISWPIAQINENGIGGVLNATVKSFALVADGENGQNACDFWIKFETDLTKDLGKTCESHFLKLHNGTFQN